MDARRVKSQLCSRMSIVTVMNLSFRKVRICVVVDPQYSENMSGDQMLSEYTKEGIIRSYCHL